MSLESKGAVNAEVNEYSKLKESKTRIVAMTTDWVARGTALHGSLSLQEEKAEIIALRNELDTEISTVLGV